MSSRIIKSNTQENYLLRSVGFQTVLLFHRRSCTQTCRETRRSIATRRHKHLSHNWEKGAGTILVNFQSHKAKSRFYKARTKLKNIRLSDVFSNASTATRVAAGQGRTFIKENFTTNRQDFLRKANDKRKDGLVISAWSLDGKIFAKTITETLNSFKFRHRYKTMEQYILHQRRERSDK